MIVFPCHICKTSLSADDAQAGQQVRCPTCLTPTRVPAGQSRAASPSAAMFPGMSRTPGKRYGFNCGYCSSRLEATEAMAAQDGQCPTCGNNITIPILDRYGRLIDPKTRQIIKQDPHPVHAYAAAGERAPAILRANDGRLLIRCPRPGCQAMSPISANNCKACGMPFTMEGTTVDAGANNGYAVASLVLGIIGVVMACIPFLLPGLALTFGIVAYRQVTQSGGDAPGNSRGMAIAGIILGVIGCFVSVWWAIKFLS
jgi:hypothetical protein